MKLLELTLSVIRDHEHSDNNSLEQDYITLFNLLISRNLISDTPAFKKQTIEAWEHVLKLGQGDTKAFKFMPLFKALNLEPPASLQNFCNLNFRKYTDILKKAYPSTHAAQETSLLASNHPPIPEGMPDSADSKDEFENKWYQDLDAMIDESFAATTPNNNSTLQPINSNYQDTFANTISELPNEYIFNLDDIPDFDIDFPGSDAELNSKPESDIEITSSQAANSQLHTGQQLFRPAALQSENEAPTLGGPIDQNEHVKRR